MGEVMRERRVLSQVFIALIAIAVILFVITHLLDFLSYTGDKGLAFLTFKGDPATARYSLSAVAGALATVLAITFSVVLIVVQLTANRYTDKVIDLFLRERANLFVLCAFVVTILYTLYVVNTIKDVETFFVPSVGIATSYVLASLCFAAVVPYLIFVFEFLKPANVISRIKTEALSALSRAHFPDVAIRREVAQRLEQIADICTSAMGRDDTPVAMNAIWALQSLMLEYLPTKGKCPPEWFHVEDGIFLGLSPRALAHIRESCTWLEVKAFRHLKHIFEKGLGRMREICNAVARSLCVVASRADEHGDEPVVDLAVKYFNSLLRSAINQGDKFTAYTVLHHYRSLAEKLITSRPWLVRKIAFYFSYYALEAEKAGLDYVVETVAYDLNILNQKAWDEGMEGAEEVLDTFLRLAEELEERGLTRGLHGVRKMYAILGSHFLLNGNSGLAHRVASKLSSVPPEELRAIRDEILSVTDPSFWEVTERIINFDYIDPEHKEKLRQFFAQFLGVT